MNNLSILLNEYREYLFDDYLPFIDKYVVDHQYGGFLCNTDRAGNNIATNKRTWYDGRGVWVYSFLYNNLSTEQKYLKIAEKTTGLLMKIKPHNGRFWPWAYGRQGDDLKEREPDIYGSLFVAEGLAEYSKAVNNPSIWDEAKSILLNCFNDYNKDDYSYIFDYGPNTSFVSGPRILGHWMIMLRLSTNMLHEKFDLGIENIAKHCVDALMVHHFNPKFDLMIEVLNHDFSIPKGPYSNFVYIGHAMEALWMVMDEAIRLKDDNLYHKASGMFKRHVEVAWDDVYGGVFHELIDVEKNQWNLDKVLWAQLEVLTGLLLMIEHSNDAWAIRWFEKIYTYVKETYPLKKHGCSLWNIGGNRMMTFEDTGVRIENYHHPRQLMLGILRIEKMIKKSSNEAIIPIKNRDDGFIAC